MRIRINSLRFIDSFGFFIAAFFMPIKTSISNIGLIVLIFTSLVSYYLYGFNLRRFLSLNFLNLSWIIFLPFLYGAIYTNYPENVSGQLFKTVFYLLIPLLLFRKDRFTNIPFKTGVLAFIFGCTLSAVYLLSINFFEFFSSHQSLKNLMSYQYTGKLFVAPIKEIHPVYLGCFYLFSLILLSQGYLKVKGYLKVLIILIIITAVFFINSRITYFLTVIFIPVLLSRFFNKGFFRLSLMVFFTLLFLLVSALKGTYIYEKAFKSTAWDLRDNIGVFNTDKDKLSDSRMSRWIASFELIEDRPFLGHGTGSSRNLLIKKYKERRMEVSLIQEYDSHNQFLGFAIDFGLFGILLLFLFFLSNFLKAHRKKDIPYALLVILVFTVCLTENFLIRNMGINFVAFWFVLFQIRNND